MYFSIQDLFLFHPSLNRLSVDSFFPPVSLISLRHLMRRRKFTIPICCTDSYLANKLILRFLTPNPICICILSKTLVIPFVSASSMISCYNLWKFDCIKMICTIIWRNRTRMIRSRKRNVEENPHKEKSRSRKLQIDRNNFLNYNERSEYDLK